jgi:ParB/RepB/Spo0J family partition protein
MSDTIIEIPLEQLHESPFNQRKIFGALDELATSIRCEGVLEPLLVRPRVAQGPGTDGWELVFGHRRARAAEVAGLPSVPCMVRAMTDAEARSAQIAENLERDDVHPLEEAASFQALVTDDGLTAEQIAQRFGKSLSYVYGRLKLLQLHPEVRQACLAGEVGAEVALLLARLRTEKLQAKALGYIKADYHCKLDDGGKASYRAVRDLLNEKFTLALKDAIFDTMDAVLLPDAGACTTCPKRTANAPEYDDVTHGEKLPNYSRQHHGPEICTDPECFDEKKRAHLALRVQELQAKGKTVVAGNAARTAISAQGEVKGAYIALKDVKAELKKATGDAKPQVVTIQDPRTGKTVEAVKRDDLVQVGVRVPAGGSGPGSDRYAEQEARRKAERAREEAKLDAEKATRLRMLHAVRDAAAHSERSAFDLRLIARAAIAGVGYYSRDLLDQLWPGVLVNDGFDVLPDLGTQDLARLMLDCALVNELMPRWTHELTKLPPNLQAAAQHYGIDLKALRAQGGLTTSKGGEGAKKATKSKGSAKPAAARGVKYCCPDTGSTWSGKGLQPKWVKAALANGRTLAELELKPKTTAAKAAEKQTDDAGCAGGRTAQRDALEEAGA